MNINRERLFDFSMGPQDATSFLLRKPNELEESRNGKFGIEIGSIVGRPGVTQWGDAFSAGKAPQGAHTARFREGAIRMVAVNNPGNTATLVRYQNSTTGVWTDLITDLPANAQVFFLDYLNEVYVSGYTTGGTPIAPRNIRMSSGVPVVSTTRNLIGCPSGHYFVEYGGLLYIANVTLNSVRYPDRVYKSSPPTSSITFVQGAQTGTLTSLKVDSVRYLKAGMAIDIYGKGSSTKKYDLTITAVDKATNTISFASTSVTVVDNDEIYADGRYGELGVFWNTDYPTPDRAEFLAVQPGTDSSNEITGVAKSSNRLFIFTENSATRWDGGNLVTFNNAVGCITQRSIRNIDDDWLIWLDAMGRVWARNETSGDQQFISRGIHNSIFSHFTEDELRTSHAAMYNNEYKLYLGALDGELIRVSYDFNSNTMAPEIMGVEPGLTIVDSYQGVTKPIIFGTDGNSYIDDLGDDDAGQPIAFRAVLGRRNFGTEGRKQFYGIFIYSQNAIGLRVMASVAGGQFVTVGSIKQAEQFIKLSETGSTRLEEASTMNIKIVGNYTGMPPVIEGVVPYFVNREDIPQNG